MAILVVLVLLAVFGLISGLVAQSRGHSFILFFLLGALISPLLAIILAFVLPKKQTARRRIVRGKPGIAGRPATGAYRKVPLHQARNPYRPPG